MEKEEERLVAAAAAAAEARPSLDDASEPVLPVEERPRVTGRSLHPAVYIVSWMFFSNVTILFNKWLLDTAGFRYPVILTCWHLVFATLATQLLARTTTLLDSRRHVKMTGRLYLRAVVPIGLMYSGSLVCSNLVYLYLSVAFIQMLKSAAPVAVLLTSWAWGVAQPSGRTFGNIVVIVLGVALASFGEIEFSWVGFLFQLGGIGFEALKLVMIQVLLSGDGQNMDPLVSLYYYAPVCAATNFAVALFSEIPTFDFDVLFRTGFGILFLNALVAFLLNVASVFLIGKTSGLVMTLTGVLKNIILIVASVIIWAGKITALQFVGYSIAIAGLLYYSLGADKITAHAAALAEWLQGALKSAPGYAALGEVGSKMSRWRIIAVASACSLVLFLLVGLLFVRPDGSLELTQATLDQTAS